MSTPTRISNFTSGPERLIPGHISSPDSKQALDQIRAEEVAAIVAEICDPLQGNLSVDAQVCPDDFEYLKPRARNAPRRVLTSRGSSASRSSSSASRKSL